jgi:molybdenum cofactor cytidylyltransferase
VIAGVVLAAGISRRFGSQKLLASVGGAPLVRRTAQALVGSALDEIVVVVGSDAEAVRAVLDGLPVRVVMNPAYAGGMSTSLRAGIDALGSGVDAAIVALADQPGVGAPIVDPIIARYRADRAPIVAPIYRGGVRGNPVLFDRAVFSELRDVTGDEGGRSVVAKDPSRVALVEFEIDMPEDIDVVGDLG